MVIYIVLSRSMVNYGFKVIDNNETEIGSVSGKFMEIERELTVSERAGDSYIKAKLGALNTRIDIVSTGKRIILTHRIGMFGSKVDISGIPWVVKGSCNSNNYKILDKKRIIAKVSATGFFGRKIKVEIEDPTEESTVIAIVVAIMAANDAHATRTAMENC